MIVAFRSLLPEYTGKRSKLGGEVSGRLVLDERSRCDCPQWYRDLMTAIYSFLVLRPCHEVFMYSGIIQPGTIVSGATPNLDFNRRLPE